MENRKMISRILIYRLGSLGDTLITLPVLNAIRWKYPSARIVALTNRPIVQKAPALAEIVSGTGLVNDVICYEVGARSHSTLSKVRNDIRSGQFDVALHLAASRGLGKSLRDYVFLKSCGIPSVFGVPWRHDDLTCRYNDDTGLYESEASRLARRMASFVKVDIYDDQAWNLHLTTEEVSHADALLAGTFPYKGLIAISPGTKVDVKDWGIANWSSLLGKMGGALDGYAIVAVGSKDEYPKAQGCLDHWPGRKLNLCGKIGVRETAAVLKRAKVFVGHDSGPMHLAATVGVPCMAIFSARNLPGQWYPRGQRNYVFYNKTECFGCNLDICNMHNKKCIMGISVESVAARIYDLLMAKE